MRKLSQGLYLLVTINVIKLCLFNTSLMLSSITIHFKSFVVTFLLGQIVTYFKCYIMHVFAVVRIVFCFIIVLVY